MSFLMRQVAHCDVCGHEWLTNKVPIHCAKCKSRKWNHGAAMKVDIVHIPHSRWPKGVRDAFKANHASSIQPADGSAVFTDQQRKVVHNAHPVLSKHAQTCKCLMCKPPK